MTNVNVAKHYRTSEKGRQYVVRAYNRNVKNRGSYNVPYLRQLDHPIKNKTMDATLKAKKPGFRYSNSGGGYYERRFNRSDSNDYI